MKAHQRLIREKEAALDPRAAIPLSECRVAAITTAEARPVIERYEWLGTMNKVPVAVYGLLGPDGEVLGVASFGQPPGTNSRLICGPEWRDRTIALERGTCVHYAHEHAASFLISRAVKACAEDHGFAVFFAYSDPEAGEIGTVYQACNWLYLGVTGRPANGSRAKWRYKGGPWRTTKSLREEGRRLGYGPGEYAAVLRADPDWECGRSMNKARYVTFAGSRTVVKAARAALRYPVLPYPKR